MNILMVPSWYKTEKDPVLGSFFREQALALVRRGHRVYVADATFQGKAAWGSPRLFRLRRLDDGGLTTYSLVVPALGISRTPSGGMGIYRKNLHRIFRALRKDGVRIDLIQAHSFYPAGHGAVWLGKRYGIPVVVSEHNSLVLTGKLPPKRVQLLKETVEGADRMVCVSEALKRAVIALTDTDKQIHVIPNSVDSRVFRRSGTGVQSSTFLSVGNLIPGKRFDLTLAAFARIHAQHQQLRLKIAGDGPLREELIRLAQELRIGDAVEFLGRIPRDQIPELFRSGGAFVLPSDAETFGVVYVEALACGLPVIATRNGGAEEIVTAEDGILVDKGDVMQLCAAMRSVYEDMDSYDRAAISRRCHERYGEAVVAERTAALYAQVIAEDDKEKI